MRNSLSRRSRRRGGQNVTDPLSIFEKSFPVVGSERSSVGRRRGEEISWALVGRVAGKGYLPGILRRYLANAEKTLKCVTDMKASVDIKVSLRRSTVSLRRCASFGGRDIWFPDCLATSLSPRGVLITKGERENKTVDLLTKNAAWFTLSGVFCYCAQKA